MFYHAHRSKVNGGKASGEARKRKDAEREGFNVEDYNEGELTSFEFLASPSFDSASPSFDSTHDIRWYCRGPTRSPKLLWVLTSKHLPLHGQGCVDGAKGAQY